MNPPRPEADAATGEEGFTLIELVIVLIIMPLVIGAVAMVLITTLKATSPGDPHGTAARLAESHDAQITSIYFGRDVQNSTQITTAGLRLCGSVGTQVLALVGDGGTSAISYVTATVGGVPVLLRDYCASGPSTTPSDISTMSHTLQSLTSVGPPVLACNATYDSDCSSDASAGLISSLDVDTVTMAVTEASGWSFTLVGSPRQSLGPTLGLVATTPPLLMTGTGGAQCGTGNEGLTVNGVLAVDSPNGSSVKVGRSGLTAQQVYSEPINDGGSPVSPSRRYTQQGAPAGTPPYATGPALPDPYAALPTPNPSAANTFVYTQPLTGGNDPATGDTTLKSGVYILKNGIDAASLTSDPGGVFLYVTGGTVILGGNSGLALSALTTGPYAGVLLYQVPSDTGAVQLQGTPAVNSLEGVVDASGAPVNLQGGNTISVLGLVSSSVTCQAGTSAFFGPQATVTKVTSSQNPSVSGQGVTFTATVTASGLPVTVGSVTFSVSATGGGTVMCTGGNVQQLGTTGPTIGKATCTTNTPLTNAGSPYTVTATYPGSLGLDGSSAAPLSQQVQVASSVAVSSSLSPSTSGQAVQFKATVTGAAPGGTVNFAVLDKNNVSYRCTGGNNVLHLTGGTATCMMDPGELLATNSPFSVTVAYQGDPNNMPSTGSLAGGQVVGQATTATGVSSSFNPSFPNAPVTFTATVSATGGGSGTPTGVVTFTITSAQGNTVNCQGLGGNANVKTLIFGRASCSVPGLSQAGSPYTVSAVYGGDPNYLTSTGPFTQRVS